MKVQKAKKERRVAIAGVKKVYHRKKEGLSSVSIVFTEVPV